MLTVEFSNLTLSVNLDIHKVLCCNLTMISYTWNFVCKFSVAIGFLFLKNIQDGFYTNKAKSKRKYTGENICRQQWRTGANLVQPWALSTVSPKISTMYSGLGRLSGYLLFFISIAECVTQIHGSHGLDNDPVIDLTDGYNNYQIAYNNLTMNLNFQDNGVVLYNSELLKNHQLFSVSKILDYTDLTVAN